MKIERVPGVEAIRQRPYLFLRGDTAAERTHSLVVETVRRCVDPAHHNGATKVSVHLFANNTIRIADNGQGVAVELQSFRGFQRPALEIMMFRLAGLSDRDRHAFGFLAGWGPILNACSARLHVRTWRDKKQYEADFARGGLVGFVSEEQAPTETLGTEITFRPDEEVVREAAFLMEYIERQMADLWQEFPKTSFEVEDARGEHAPAWLVES